MVAFGGWPMDDHNPGGMATKAAPTTFHTAPTQYGIPYRSLYSKNIENLFCAGRNISATHAAMSSSITYASLRIRLWRMTHIFPAIPFPFPI